MKFIPITAVRRPTPLTNINVVVNVKLPTAVLKFRTHFCEVSYMPRGLQHLTNIAGNLGTVKSN
jgi:hypothetical protein